MARPVKPRPPQRRISDLQGWTLNAQRPYRSPNEGGNHMILEGTITTVEGGKSSITVKPLPTAPQTTPGKAPPAQPAVGSPTKEMALTVKKDATITLDGKKVGIWGLKSG